MSVGAILRTAIGKSGTKSVVSLGLYLEAKEAAEECEDCQDER